MLTPHRFEAPPACIERGWRLIRITEAIPEISGLVATYENEVTSFEGLYNAWKLMRRNASVAMAKQHEAEAALDEEIRGVGLAILKVNRGRRKSSTRNNYFPRGMGETLRHPADQALQISAGLIASMANETRPDIVARREPLETARANLVTAIQTRQAAAEAKSQAKAVLEEGKAAWRTATLSFYFGVRTQFPDRRQWVEAIFRDPGQRRSEEEEGDEQEQQGQPAQKPDNGGGGGTGGGSASGNGGTTGNGSPSGTGSMTGGGSASGNGGTTGNGSASGNSGTSITGTGGEAQSGSTGTPTQTEEGGTSK